MRSEKSHERTSHISIASNPRNISTDLSGAAFLLSFHARVWHHTSFVCTFLDRFLLGGGSVTIAGFVYSQRARVHWLVYREKDIPQVTVNA